jgi:hypothetical protein
MRQSLLKSTRQVDLWIHALPSDAGYPVSMCDSTTVYEIRVRGGLSRTWAEAFAPLALTPEPGGDTLIASSVPDQSALFGLLDKVRNLGLTLISVNPIAGGEPVACRWSS